MADEIRRLRTQDERAADDHAWRATAATRPGYATWPDTRPGDPSWWRRAGDQPPTLHRGGPIAGEPKLLHLHPDECVLVARETGAVVCVRRDHPHHNEFPLFVADPDIHHGPPVRPPHRGPAPDSQPAPPRRRWWHRHTRRAQ